MSVTQQQIWVVCEQIRDMLLKKNRAYGDSALDPVRVFSRATPIEQLLVRMDDKISRMVRGDLASIPEEDLEATVTDLAGYCILLKIALSASRRATSKSPAP